VKYNPSTGQFVLFEINNAHTQSAFAQAKFSYDGVVWSDARPLTGPMEGAHNIGVKSDTNGYIQNTQQLQIMFGLPWGGRPKSEDVWKEWDLYTTYIRLN
jgi:hypothetical protein